MFEIGYDSLDGVQDRRLVLPPARELPAGAVSRRCCWCPATSPSRPCRNRGPSSGTRPSGVAPRGKLRSNRQFNPGYPGLLLDNALDRNTYSYRGLLRRRRPRARLRQDAGPRCDPTRIGVHGSSQGGALDDRRRRRCGRRDRRARPARRTSAASWTAPSLSHTYPYEEINEYLRLYPDREPALHETMAYFDVRQHGAAGDTARRWSTSDWWTTVCRPRPATPCATR